MNRLGSILKTSLHDKSLCTPVPLKTNVKLNYEALSIIPLLKQVIHFKILPETKNLFSLTIKMFYEAVAERERYLYSASTSNSLAAKAAAPEARVVNSISFMFIVVAPNIPWLFLPSSMCCRCSGMAS